MIYIGIDPGLDGGIAFLGDQHLIGGPSSEYGKIGIRLYKTPVIAGKDYDIQEMKFLLKYIIGGDLFCTIENQISMPGQGLTSTLQTGKGFGIWLGLLAALEVPHQVVHAKQWQTKLFTGTSSKLDTKARSEIIAKRLFPNADFRRSERARVANDGLTDAACIAEYGRRTHSVGDPGTGIAHTPLQSSPEICSVCGRYIPGDAVGCFTNK